MQFLMSVSTDKLKFAAVYEHVQSVNQKSSFFSMVVFISDMAQTLVFVILISVFV